MWKRPIFLQNQIINEKCKLTGDSVLLVGLQWRVQRGKKRNKEMKWKASRSWCVEYWVLFLVSERVWFWQRMWRWWRWGSRRAARRCPHQENSSDAGWCVTGSEQHGSRGRRVTLPFVSRAAACVALAAPRLTAELEAVTGERLRLPAFQLRSGTTSAPFVVVPWRLMPRTDLVLDVVRCCRGRWHPVPAQWPHPTARCRLRPLRMPAYSGSCKQRAWCAISPPVIQRGWLSIRNTHGEHVDCILHFDCPPVLLILVIFDTYFKLIKCGIFYLNGKCLVMKKNKNHTNHKTSK